MYLDEISKYKDSFTIQFNKRHLVTVFVGLESKK
jgi:hypothetical protein